MVDPSKNSSKLRKYDDKFDGKSVHLPSIIMGARANSKLTQELFASAPKTSQWLPLRLLAQSLLLGSLGGCHTLSVRDRNSALLFPSHPSMGNL
jgi:hypothetical protein